MDTLAIVAYRQPITRPEVDDVRGVDSGAVLKSLLERDLVRILGKREEPGRPMLYGTTAVAILWLATRPLPRLAPRALASVSLVAAVGLLALRLPAYAALSDRSADYSSVAPCIAHGRTLIQANLFQFIPSPLHHLEPMIEETGVLSAATQGHDLGSVEGAVPFYPIRNLASNDPYRYLPTTRETGYRWGSISQNWGSPGTQALLSQNTLPFQGEVRPG